MWCSCTLRPRRFRSILHRSLNQKKTEAEGGFLQRSDPYPDARNSLPNPHPQIIWVQDCVYPVLGAPLVQTHLKSSWLAGSCVREPLLSFPSRAGCPIHPRPTPPAAALPVPGLCRLSASRGVSEPLGEHPRPRAPGSAAGTRAAASHAGAQEPPPPPFRCRRWGEGDAAAPPRAAAGGRGLLSGAAPLSLPLAPRGRLGPARVGEGSSRRPRASAAQDLRGLPAQISPARGRGPRPNCPTCSGPRRRLARREGLL